MERQITKQQITAQPVMGIYAIIGQVIIYLQVAPRLVLPDAPSLVLDIQRILARPVMPGDPQFHLLAMVIPGIFMDAYLQAILLLIHAEGVGHI